MNMKKIGISLLMVFVLIASLGVSSFAAVGDSVSAEVYSKARRSCFNKGILTLTEVIPRGLAIEAEAYAYHDVDEISIKVYLQELKNGSITDLKTWTVRGYNTDYTELNKAYTVPGNASYRLYAIYSTKHSADGVGTEGGSASTEWMWVD